ncbi:MAG TPA: hypothetical protein VLM76_11605 [Patescibacteria group bacterium]|nr:hypothetical protein [Patescibacteria group bacterium]
MTVALLMVGTLGAGVAGAHGPVHHPSGPPATNPSTSHRAVSYSARCTPAFAGGSIKVQARVGHAVRGRSFTATASAAFTGATASVNLRRAGKSFVALGRIPVPAAQAIGPVTVTVTITYDGTSTVRTCTSRIHVADASDTLP